MNKLRPGLNIVVIDDNRDLLIAFSMLLEVLQCKVHTADSAEEGLKLIKEIKPNAAFIDISMPVMNGYQVAEALRGDGFDNMLIAVSGYDHEEARQQSMDAGFNFHMAKPASLEQITSLLASL